jgi:hypothetical protein
MIAGVFFAAMSCRHCGSSEPSGPFIQSARAPAAPDEERNDHRLLTVTLLCRGIGIAFGVLTSAGLFSALLAAVFYGAIGLIIGVTAAFIINMSHRLFR